MGRRRRRLRQVMGIAAVVAALVLVARTGMPARAAETTPAAAADPAVSPEHAKFFEMKVRPLLAQSCFQCHGEKKRKGGLRLDSLEAMLKGGDNGAAVVPGQPEKSAIIEAIGYKNEDLQMPPEEPLAAADVAILTEWVKMGAPWPKTAGPVTVTTREKPITDEHRAWWSFQPVKDPPVPTVSDNGWSKNAIDRFVVAKLQSSGMTPAMQADKHTLVRRAYFDLHGLPPTPAEVDAFVNDASPDAWEKLIDKLLASPRYGERWGRHWLDLVRYAESDGYRQDAYRTNAWPYRDYVIKSFNDDKPYNRFVTEQLAGDELDPTNPDVMVATGFLRGGLYEYNQRDVRTQWSEIVNEVTDVTGDVFLGLSMGCARCHDHKFDPILQADYYRLQSFFSPILPRNDLPLASPEAIAAYKAKLKVWEEKTAPIRDELAKIEAPYIKKTAEGQIKMFPPDVQEMMRKAPADRTPFEHQLAELAYRQVYEKTDALKIGAAEKERWTELQRKLGEFDDIRPKPLMDGLLCTDVGPAAPKTVIPKSDRVIEPGYLVVLEKQPLNVPAITATKSSTGRRSALAKWITQPGHPLTTRVIANRIWQYHFGRGIVGTSSDYGTLGEKPTHPELLDWLATRFVEQGWSFKAMHRLIMTSAAYRQSATRPTPEIAKLKDPDNKLLWRYNTRRLDAEQIRDAMLAVSGELDLPAATASGGGASADTTAPRRSIYTKVIRNVRDPVLDAFDAPDAFASAAQRNSTVTSPQALLMINGQWPLQRAAAFAARVTRDAGTGADHGKIVEQAYRVAYGRLPSADEKDAAVKFLAGAGDTSVVANDGGGEQPGAVAVSDMMDMDGPLTKTMPHRGGQAFYVRNANPADMLKLPAGAAIENGDFTVEAFVMLDSLYPDASVRVIASQWSGKQTEPGWSFGVTSEKSKHQPRNLILQLAGRAKADGPIVYEVIPSDLRPELNKTYYVAVSVKVRDTGPAGVTFYMHDLTDNDFVTKVATVKHSVTQDFASDARLVVGGRDSRPVHGWDGLIDEVRISNAALSKQQLLFGEDTTPPAKDNVVAHWTFEAVPGLMKDLAGRQKELLLYVTTTEAAAIAPKGGKGAPTTKPAAKPAVKVSAALVDLCHALLNSNEFLYVD